jgi:anti-sigma regulatory factor (Ser/Thr protein kinase)
VGDDQVSESFEPEPAEARRARHFLQAVLERDERFRVTAADVDRLVLAVNEVVTNAVLHARTTFSATVRRVPEGILVEVCDGNTRMPLVGRTPPDATSGRGLLILDSVGVAWGVERRPEGKVVWLRVGGPGPTRNTDQRPAS